MDVRVCINLNNIMIYDAAIYNSHKFVVVFNGSTTCKLSINFIYRSHGIIRLIILKGCWNFVNDSTSYAYCNFLLRKKYLKYFSSLLLGIVSLFRLFDPSRWIKFNIMKSYITGSQITYKQYKWWDCSNLILIFIIIL